MTFRPGELRIFDRAGAPLGSLSGWSLTGPPSFRLNEVEDFAFSLPRNDGGIPIITGSVDPVRVGVSQLVSTGNNPASLTHPRASRAGDVLIAVLAYNPGGSATCAPLTPTGWTRVAHSRNENRVGSVMFTRTLKVGDPAATAFSFSGNPTRVSATLLAVRGLSGRIGGVEVGVSAPSATHIVKRPEVTEAKSLTVTAFTNWGNTTLVPGAGGYTQATNALHLNIAMLVATRVEPREDDAGGNQTATSASQYGAHLSVSFEPSPSVERLLRRDNLVYVSFNQAGMRGWGGYIDSVTYSGGTAQVDCLGTAGLLGNLSTTLIEQDEGEAKTLAQRMVQAANAKQAAHGDLVVGFKADSTRPVYGRFTYEGDILKGVQQLAERTVSEYWMESWVEDDGLFKTVMHWGSTYEIDKTAVVLGSGATLGFRDGTGGNLSPDTEVSFSGAERVNYARMYGATTNIVEYLDYPSAMGLFSDIVPEAVVSIPEPNMPGARRRESLDFSVDWGLSITDQKGMAQKAQNTYLRYYKQFLYAYHARFGMPFVDGFDWSGPEPDQFSKLSQRHFRTIAAFARIGNRDIVTNWDPEDDADVTLEGWHYIRGTSNWPGSGIVGIAYDHADPGYRWMAFKSFNGTTGVVASVEAGDEHDYDPDSDWKVTAPGETIKGVASSPLEPNIVWTLTADATRTWVRSWDVGTAGQKPELLTAWSMSGITHSALAVDVGAGTAWTVRNGSSQWEKRDLNGGALLDTFASNIGSGAGIAISGPVAYLMGVNGKIEMRFTEDGAWGGAKDVDGTFQALFVDPYNNAIWMAQTTGNIVQMYSAAIAIYEIGAPGPVDGAPGFPAIAKGQFVRIVMTDNRDLDAPPEGGQRGLLGVLHRNQYGRFMPSGKTWLPRGERQGERWRAWGDSAWGRNYNNQNCSYAAGAMLLDRHTRGSKRVTPVALRNAAHDGQHHPPENNFEMQEKAWRALGEDFNNTGYNPGKWSDLIDRLREGRGISLKTDFDGIPEKFRCQAGYNGNHQLYLHRLGGDGTIVVHDPLCTRPKRIPIEHVKRAAARYISNTGAMGRAEFGWSRDTTRRRAPVDDGRARSFFIVWSEGKWVEEASPTEPGSPAILSKRWDPGEQKSGFKEAKKVTITDPALVVYGEEGRVADWDPVSMGYGVHFSGNTNNPPAHAYYKTKGGDKRWSTGWHLVPWDVPLSTFSFGQPEWPEGEAYLRAQLDHFNREQGAQSLGVVNVDSVWTHVELGGIYTLTASLQGPYPDGISGRVRVVAFTPDPTNGVMQCLCEWLG